MKSFNDLKAICEQKFCHNPRMLAEIDRCVSTRELFDVVYEWARRTGDDKVRSPVDDLPSRAAFAFLRSLGWLSPTDAKDAKAYKARLRHAAKLRPSKRARYLQDIGVE